MSKVLVSESNLSGIAAAIRGKNGTQNTYKPGQMAAAITALPGASALVSKQIAQNGSYDPANDNADGYSAVTVNVPNSYAAGDEGKVVSNGALVQQTARASEITANGTYDTTNNNSITVNIQGGGGMVIAQNAGAHNSVYRGSYLGDHVTAAQYAAIAAGTFDDIFIGDYWEINNVTWRVAAFDYWLHCGDDEHECVTHHVVIVPDTCIVAGVKMNSTNTTSGAYAGSNYYTGANNNTGKAQAQTVIEAAFGTAHILTHREYLKNGVSSNYENSGAWYDSTFELMTEQMVFGGLVYSNEMQGTSFANRQTISKTQLPLFAYEPSRIGIRVIWWLRDVVDSKTFTIVNLPGEVNNASASREWGLRPAFAICAANEA